MKPIVFTGVGDKIVKLSGAASTDAMIVTLTHRGSANFIVSPLDSTGQETGNLVNAIGIYAGTVPLGFDGSTTAALKVQADGRWSMTIRPVAQARRWVGTSPLTGKGDDVVVVSDAVDSSGLNTVTLTHSGQANFIVDAYGNDSGQTNLVNEIGNYHGQVVLPSDSLVITVQADGAWTVSKG